MLYREEASHVVFPMAIGKLVYLRLRSMIVGTRLPNKATCVVISYALFSPLIKYGYNMSDSGKNRTDSSNSVVSLGKDEGYRLKANPVRWIRVNKVSFSPKKA